MRETVNGPVTERANEGANEGLSEYFSPLVNSLTEIIPKLGLSRRNKFIKFLFI